MDIALSPKLLTDFRLGYYRYNVIDIKHDQGAEFATQLGIPGINTGRPLHLRLAGLQHHERSLAAGGGTQQASDCIGDGLNINRCNCPLTEREDQFQIVNNWTKVIGNHTLKVGADLRYGRNLRVPSDRTAPACSTSTTGPLDEHRVSNRAVSHLPASSWAT